MKALIIARREWRSLFLSPLAWIVLGVVQFLLAWLFLLQMDQYLMLQPRLAGIPGGPGVTDMIIAPVISTASALMLVIVPLLSMRSFAEERRSGSLTLLRAAPVSTTDIVLGKYLGLLGFLVLSLLLLAAMLLSLALGTDIDIGKTFAGLLGLLLMTAAFAAVGIYLSTLTRQPAVAALASFGLLLLLWLVESSSPAGEGMMQFIALLGHFRALLRGLVSSADIIYFIVFIGGFLAFSVRRLENDRLEN